VSVIGQTTSGISGLDFHDNDHRALINLPVAREKIAKHRDVIKGIKVRVYTGMADLYALEQARILADEVKMPILVHLGPGLPAAADTLALLQAGDMITHPYHGGEDTILDANNNIRSEFIEARDRGVEVDLGMDRFHCDLRVMGRAFELGFFPDYVSTDLTLTNLNSITFDLPTTISKCVALGMPLEEALRRATVTVADKLAVPDLTGRLEVGHCADIAVFTRAPMLPKKPRGILRVNDPRFPSGQDRRQPAAAIRLSKPLGSSISTSSVDTLSPLSIRTMTFSGSSMTCRETTASISSRRIPSKLGWPRRPRSCAKRICSLSRATGAEPGRRLSNRKKFMLMPPSVQAAFP
jgi:hypothetical protein